MDFLSTLEDNKINLPPFDHKEPEGDDCGLRENPIFSDYAKYLWKGHVRSGGVQAPNRSPLNTDGGARDK
jgi:hypothetical protein